MALPTTITGISTAISCVGPYKSSAGNVYFFGRDGTTATTLQAFKATDPTSSFASIDTETGFSTAVQHISGYQVGDVIHLCVIDGATTSVNAKYQTFDMSSDTFVTAETIASAFDPQASTGANVYEGSIVVRDGGEVVVIFNGENVANMGSSYSRTYWSRRTGVATWTAAADTTAGGQTDWRFPDAVLGASDRVHFMWTLTAETTLRVRTLTSGNTLGTEQNTTSASSVVRCVSYDDAGTQRIICLAQSDDVVSFTSADSPTLGAGDTAVIASATAPFGLFVDGTDLWAVFRKSTDSDLYAATSTDDGAIFTGEVNIFTATVAAVNTNISIDGQIFQRGSSVVIPYVVNDNGTLKYNEYEVRTVAGGGEVFINRGLLFTSKLVRSRLLRRV